MNLLQRQIASLNKTLKQKWYPMLAGEAYGFCNCCSEFEDEVYCGECPIAMDEKVGCTNKEYRAWYDFKNKTDSSEILDYEYDLMFDLKAATQWEIDYIEGLRDKLQEKLK